MGNSNGRFIDQVPEVLGVQIMTAKTSVSGALNVAITEANGLTATNTFLSSNQITSTDTSPPTVVANTAQATVGADKRQLVTWNPELQNF